MTLTANESTRLARWRDTIIDLLRAHGFTHLHISYHGCDGIREISARQTDDKFAGFASSPLRANTGAALVNTLRAFCWHVVYHHHPHFHDGEGGDGTLTIDVTEKQVTLDHIEFYTAENRTITRL